MDHTEDMSCSSTLSHEQVLRLVSALHDKAATDAVDNIVPTLHVRPLDLLLAVRERLLADDVVAVRGVVLNGSAASFVVGSEDVRYNDLDLIYHVDFRKDSDFDYIRQLAISCFAEAVRKNGGNPPLCKRALEEIYVANMLKVHETSDQWSLFSFRNGVGKNIELKFVGKMRRQFEFSVDSFHVSLDSYLQFRRNGSTLTADDYPVIRAISLWGNFEEAVSHVRERIIATICPETIHGGGLLKYCKLLVLGYKPVFDDLAKAERYMCSRFFIDLPNIAQFQVRLQRYLQIHFSYWGGMEDVRSFLEILIRVIFQSSCCLMAHDRQTVLAAIKHTQQRVAQSFWITPRWLTKQQVFELPYAGPNKQQCVFITRSTMIPPMSPFGLPTAYA